MKSARIVIIAGLLALFMIGQPRAQQQQKQLMLDYSQLMEIPDIVSMKASPAHLYVLSGRNGMAVFRAYSDSLQWLYTSNGMQRRGTKIMADIRFAYLYGNSKRLTVLEPTSALGVYSSAFLPVAPLSVARIDNQLYIAMGNEGLGYLSLESPESVDSPVQYVESPQIAANRVLDVRAVEGTNQLFVLLDNESLLIFESLDGNLDDPAEIPLSAPIRNIFITNEQVWGATAAGDVFEITDSGLTHALGSVDEGISDFLKWNETIFARTQSGKVWTTFNREVLAPWKTDGQAGNQIATANNRLWLAENNKIAEVKTSDLTQVASTSTGAFKIKGIPNQVVTFPNPLIMALELEGSYSAKDVEFSYRSNIRNAEIRKQGFYWQPTNNQIGMHWFKVVATNEKGESDSTRFMVDVRSFNAPPRFAPVRGTTIAVNEEYLLQFKAVDPENPSGQLIRYIGVDLPEGASVNERTGEFSWTPSERQIGESTFKIIATDRQGAAASIDVTLRVLDISRDQSQ